MAPKKFRTKGNAPFFSFFTSTLQYFFANLNVNQDKLIDAYNENGVFPTSIPIGSEKYFEGPIRSHFKPRSTAPALCYAAWTYFTWPMILRLLSTTFGTGLTSLLAGFAVMAISKFNFKISYIFLRLLL